MKYYSLIILFTLATAFSAKAQTTNKVGVGTNSPQGTFHIDAAKNTSGTTNVGDDVIVKESSGNVGLGVIAPINKLHISGNTIITGNDSVTSGVGTRNNYTTKNLKYGTTLTTPKAKLDIEASTIRTGLRLDNGTQSGGANFIPVLGTDATGNAVWKDLESVTEMVKGSIEVDKRILDTSAATYYPISGSGLTIPSGGGLWLIYAKVIVGNYAATSTANTYGTGRRDIFMYLRNGSNNEAVTVVYPETAGNCIGILQLTHIFDAGNSSASAVTLDLAVKSVHVQTGGTPTGNDRYRAYKTYGGSFWTDPVFFAIRVDYQNN